MTEFNPFTDALDEPPAVVEEAEQSGNRKAVLAVGGLTAVVLAAGAFFFLGGDGGSEDVVSSAAAAPAAAPAPVPSAQAVTLPAKADLRLGRNPFEAKYVAPKAAPAAAASTAPAPVAPAAPTTVVVVDTGSAPAGTPGGTAGGGAGGAAGGGGGGAAPAPAPKRYDLVLEGVAGEGDARRAVFAVDGKQQTVKVGETFGPIGQVRLLSLQEGPGEGEWTAVLQVGDGDPFDVTTGEKRSIQ